MPGTTPTGQGSRFEPLAVVPRYYYSSSFLDTYMIEDQGDLLFEAKILWVGSVPGLVGVYQVNLLVVCGKQINDYPARRGHV
jgi:hypothetical protein